MFKIKYIRNIFLFGLLSFGFLSFGQTKKDSLQYTLDLNLSGRKISGTFKQLVAGGGLGLDIKYGNWHLENKTNYRYNETNSRLIEDNWYDLVTLKYYPSGSKKIYPGAFYHYDNNLIYRVNNRNQYGIGIGTELNKEAIKLSLIVAVGFENSSFNGFQFVNSDRDFSKRENGLLMLKLNHGYTFAKKRITIVSQLFYFQSFRENQDFDIWLNSKISFKIWKGISANIVYDYRFENVHLETLSNYNDILLFGINLQVNN